MDISKEKITQLRNIFPEVFCEDEIDFDQLKRVLGNFINSDAERFGLNWKGKAECFKNIQQPSIGTLKPCKDESVNFDTTKNLFIEGDNLEVLKLLQRSYSNKVKMIYIDPPYNTGKDFIYTDNYEENLESYLKYTGQRDNNNNKFSTNTESDGRYHSKWLNMMYPRLYLAKSLLRDDGVIFISIDDHEHHHLRMICDQIFGEENFIADMVVVRSEGGGLAKQIVKGHDNLLSYSKDINNFQPFRRPKEIRGKIIIKNSEEYWLEDDWLRKEFGKYGTCHYEEIIETKGEEKKEEIDEGLRKGIYQLIRKKNGLHAVARLRNVAEDGSKFYSVLKHLNAKGKGDLVKLGIDNIFSFPKPLSLLKELVLGVTRDTTNKEDIVLDFFAGSSSTADAVMQLNTEDGGNRKYIMVQIPEICSEKSEAFKAGYKTIADIGKERIRRAAEKIKLEKPEYRGDLGFKVFKLDSSNFHLWNGELNDEKEFYEQLNLCIDHVKNNTSENILYEIMLKLGLELTDDVVKVTSNHKQIFSFNNGKLLVCLEHNINEELIEEILTLNPDKIIFLDRGFKGNDLLKINTLHKFKNYIHDNRNKEIEFITI